METSPALRVDPEEDEIFFYEVTEKEVKLKGLLRTEPIQSEVKVHTGLFAEENNQISQTTAINLGSTNLRYEQDNLTKVIYTSDSNVPIDSSSMFSTVAEDKVKCCDNTTGERNLIDEKKEQLNETSQNKISIIEDDSYSTPVKTVIDKNILKTPKTIVKADKDGGFLKVLSEIALVKAEADEDNYDVPKHIEEIKTDDKENNENFNRDSLKTEVTPLSFLENSSEEKINPEKQNHKFSLNFDKFEEKVMTDCHILKEAEEHLDNDKNESIDTLKNNHTFNEEDICCELENSPPHRDDTNIDEVEVIFEKLTIDTKKPIDEFKSEAVPCSDDLIKLDSFIDKPFSEVNECNDKENENIKKENNPMEIQQKTLLDESLLPIKETENACLSPASGLFIEDERHKVFLRRQTMRLLEELSELVSHEQVKREPEIGKATLSEEAAKVIEKLKSVGMDDSVQAADQYFDLDNLNETFLSNEVTDILNDTLSKPLDLLTNNDIAVLLEKISSTTLDDKIQNQNEIKDILDAEKENIHQNKECSTKNVEDLKSHKTRVNRTPLKNTTPSANVRNPQKLTPTNKFLSDDKKSYQKPLIQSQCNQNAHRGGCQTAEKALKSNPDTKIPKLTSTTSKLPVKGLGNNKIQPKTPNKYKSPFPKATRNLKFENINSPVQAYINSKTPVLISNVKGKSEPGLNIRAKHAIGATTTAKSGEEMRIIRNEPKLNLPYVKYKSAIPLKLEKAPESRLPRLAPKMQKLILGNSPVIEKHEGRIHLTPHSQTKSPPKMNESSMVLKPNEVSVIVRKVAFKCNAKKT